jgi:hypothetical protein
MRAGKPRRIMARMRAFPLLLLLGAMSAQGEGFGDFFTGGKAGLDLRLRYEGVEQSDMADSAGADTLRIRLGLESGVVRGFSGFAQLDHVEALADARYDDTRNGKLEYPVVPDPQGTDLNQAWLQYAGAAGTVVRAGRQRIAIGNERFVGPVGWRQNEQSFDAIRVDTAALPATQLTYAYVDRVLRVFGPEEGAPPAELSSDSHLFDARVTALPVGALALYGYHLDFGNAPQLSADTVGARYDGERALAKSLTIGWALEYAAQQDAGANVADVDAHYQLLEIRLQKGDIGVLIGRETLSGKRGSYDAATNPAFQTPLATLHPFQGWADKFTTTPSAGVVDAYLGASAGFRGWKGQATWHEFGAEATDATYGTELDLALSRKFAGRYELLAKYADYSADGLFTSTRKFWLQLTAAF